MPDPIEKYKADLRAASAALGKFPEVVNAHMALLERVERAVRLIEEEIGPDLPLDPVTPVERAYALLAPYASTPTIKKAQKRWTRPLHPSFTREEVDEHNAKADAALIAEQVNLPTGHPTEHAPTCPRCGGTREERGTLTDDGYSSFACVDPFHRKVQGCGICGLQPDRCRC